MAKNIEPTLKLISGYLKLGKSANFVIPEYQRGYSWGITQCDKLWQDIEAYIASDGTDPYFFGTIIIDCSDGDNKFSLIDGQQRTTTFLLLLKALLLRLNAAIENIPKNDEDSESLKDGLKDKRKTIMSILYKAEAEDIQAILKDYTKLKGILILENNSINELFKDEIKTIIEAKDYDSAELSVHKIPRKQKDNKYTNHFRNFKNFYEKLKEKSELSLNLFAKKFLEECQIIEIRSWQMEQAITMFNSLNSTGMPLSDADIISAKLYNNSDTEKSEFNDQWENINKLANELNTLKIVDINAVLMQFMYINRALQKDYIKNESVDVTVPGVRRYYTILKEELLKTPLTLCEKLMKILSIWDKIKTYPVIKLLLKFNENAKVYLSGYLYRFDINDIDEEKVKAISECLLRLFTILELVDAGYSSKNFKTFLFGVNIKLVDTDIDISDIVNDFDAHLSTNWKEADLTEYISVYDKNILVYLNEYLYAKSKGLKFDFKENVNIEHIMPASGKNIDTIRLDAGISDKDEFETIANKLGNKILLEEDINKSIGNEWFKTKIQSSVKDKSGYKDSMYPIALELTKYQKNTWGKDDIETSTDRAAKRIIKFIFNN
jgi:hypothetical protein